MMRIALCLLTIVLLAGHGRTVTNAARQSIAERPTEQESREARRVAAEFISRIQKTRDIAALKDLYVDDFVGRRMKAGQASLNDLGAALFDRTVPTAETDARAWDRFYAAQVNLKYFMALYYLANGEKIFTHEPTMTEICPPEVLSLLNTNPFLAEKSPDKKYKIESLEEFRAVLATLERAAAMMRERFLESPPEQSDRYRENVRAWAENEPEEEVYVQTGDWSGFPNGTRFFRLRTSPQLFDLMLVGTGEGMKLVWANVYVFD